MGLVFCISYKSPVQIARSPRDEKGNKAEGDYADGKKKGFWTEWYPNGQKKFEGPYIKGLEHGQFTHWTPDGRKKGNGFYRFGKYDGKWKVWNEDGKLMELFYKDGLLIGKSNGSD